MIIDNFAIAVEHAKDASFLTVRGRPFGVQARLTLAELEALAQELTRAASIWRRRIAENLYTVLGVPQTATPEEIQKAYRKLQKIHHPDSTTKGGTDEVSKQLNAAYGILSDQLKRKAYDETINQQERS